LLAGYRYSYRSHNPHDEFDPWETEGSHNSEQLCRPALDEFEGRRMIAGDPYQNPGTYVMKIETTVERVHPSMFSESYRQRSPPRYEHRRSYGVVNNQRHGPSIPSNDRPPVVEEFFNKIQNEVSQPSGFSAPRVPHQLRIPVSAGYYGTTGNQPPVVEEFSNKIQNEVSKPSGYGAPRAPYQVKIPVSAGYYGTTGNTQDSDHEKERHKPVTNTMKGEETDCGDLKAGKILKPPVTTEGVYGARPGHPTGPVLPSHHLSSERERTSQPPSTIMAGHWERRVPNMELSKPMNDIDTAMEYLKKVLDPSSVNTITDEVPDPGHYKGDKIPKLPVATEGGTAVRPGHPTESILPNNYTSSERGERTIQPLSMTTTGGRERRGHVMGLEPMNETGKIMEFSKEAVKPSLGSKVPQKDSILETIDSKEARRRYGNAKSSPEQNYTTTIDSREAARRYKGEFV
ncbi:uncharacterized protein LOC115685921, partial [Syzygium oleosum]|uniref:uncharacterized protein LOC115685921 n=1 Tax=Syzygium oleosum TaxID=219896 RepID=UPI0024B9A032